MAAMLHARNNTILFLWDKMFILMQNIFIVPGMQVMAAMQNLYCCRRAVTDNFRYCADVGSITDRFGNSER